MTADRHQASEALRVVGLRLGYIIGQVTPEEFESQDENYDRDSALGRELLFLIANNDWVRATSEIIDIPRSDTISTSIAVDVDLDRVTHEFFRDRIGRIWLPVVVLPPLRQRLPDPDPFSALTVTDPAGSPLMTLSHADVRHRIAAALTEIILAWAAAGQDDAGDPGFSATRDHRLLLSAAIYRLLRGEHVPVGAVPGDVPSKQVLRGPLPRIDWVREQLGALLARYSELLADPVPCGDSGVLAARKSIQQAIQVLRAFAESVVVVVSIERAITPAVLTVTLPSRAVHLRRGDVPRRWSRTGALWPLQPSNWVLPSADLRFDLLLASAETDRQVRVNLPHGMSPDPSLPQSSRAELEITSERLHPLSQLAAATGQLIQADPQWPPSLCQCLADRAGASAMAAIATLRDYQAGDEFGQQSLAKQNGQRRTLGFRDRLHRLSTELQDISAHGASPGTWERLTAAWADGSWLDVPMRHRTTTETVSPGVVAARARMVESSSQQTVPTRAVMHVHLAVTDSRYFQAGALSGWLSALLMTIVLVLFAAENVMGNSAQSVGAGALPIVLTLLTAVLAVAFDRPDRSTLRGLLVSSGIPLVVAPIVPPMILAAGLALSQSNTWVIAWVGGCLAGQLLLLFLQRLLLSRALARGSLIGTGIRDGSGLVFYTDAPDYAHAAVLHSSWWRQTTAQALMIGRPAYGYVVWQHDNRQTLRSLLVEGRPASTSASQRRSPVAAASSEPAAGADLSALEQPAGLLALQRFSVGSQILNFAVFRDEPKAGWNSAHEDVVRVDLDPRPLTPAIATAGWIAVFVGFRPDTEQPVRDHPIAMVLHHARQRGLTAGDIQLPVPPPATGYADLRWARARLGLTLDDQHQLGPFLNDLADLAAHGDRPDQNGPTLAATLLVAVQTRSEGIPRLLSPLPAATTAGQPTGNAEHWQSQPVLTSDLDVLMVGDARLHDSPSATWRVMAIGADWQNGIENRILADLDDGLTLAGMTTANLYGKLVMLLICHQAGGPRSAGQLRLAPLGKARVGQPALYLDRWQSTAELGTAPHRMLLHVHMRAPDRPGATLYALESLREALHDATAEFTVPSSRSTAGPIVPPRWEVTSDHVISPHDRESTSELRRPDWQVRDATVAADGSVARIQLTIMLPDGGPAPDHAQTWGPAEFAQIERRTLSLLARKLATAPQARSFTDSISGTSPGVAIRVELVHSGISI